MKDCAICGHPLQAEGLNHKGKTIHLFCYIVADSAKVGLPGFGAALAMLKEGRNPAEVRQIIKEGLA